MDRRRGSTLAEMIIVMAVVSIMTVMVISFSTLCNGWVHIGINRYRLTQSEHSISATLHDFISYFDNEDYTVMTYDGKSVTAKSRTDETKVYEYRYDEQNSTITYKLPDRESTFPVEFIETLYITTRHNSTTGKGLMMCTVKYRLPETTASKFVRGDFTVCVSTQNAGGVN